LVHNVVAQVGYNLVSVFEKTRFAPLLSVFCKLPIAGKAVVDTATIGGQLRVNF